MQTEAVSSSSLNGAALPVFEHYAENVNRLMIVRGFKITIYCPNLQYEPRYMYLYNSDVYVLNIKSRLYPTYRKIILIKSMSIFFFCYKDFNECLIKINMHYLILSFHH